MKQNLTIEHISWWFPDDEIYSKKFDQLSDVNTPGYIDDLRKPWLSSTNALKLNISETQVREIGLQRPRSASRSNSIAAILFNYACNNLEKKNNIALLALSSSAVPSIAFTYEKYGLEKGWQIVDPYWLPNSIPSALGTNLARIRKETNISYTFIGGIDSVMGAIEAAYYMLIDKIVDRVMIICSEQINTFQVDAEKQLKKDYCHIEGAYAIALSSEPTNKLKITDFCFGQQNIIENTDVIVTIPDPEPQIVKLTFPLLLLKELKEANKNEIKMVYQKTNGQYWKLKIVDDSK